MEIQWTLVLFTALSGTGACLFASSVIGELAGKDKTPSKLEAIVSFILLVVGGFMSVLHLKHVDRIFEALNRPTSGIFIEAALVGIMCVIVAIYFLMVIRDASATARKVVGVIGVVVGLVFAYECGASYMMEARPAWATITLPLAYAGTAITAGTALNLFLKVQQKREAESVKFASLLALVGGVLGVLTAGIFCIMAGGNLFNAQHNASLWLIILFAALIGATVLSALIYKKAESNTLYPIIALVCATVAVITFRVVMWLVGSPIADFFLMPLE